MKKICFITTVFGTIESFVIPTIEYLHNNIDCDISIICDYDETVAEKIPEYVRYCPVKMQRGISLSGIKSCWNIRKIFKQEKFDMIQYSTPNASLYSSVAGKMANIPVRLYCQWGIVFSAFSGIKRKILKVEEKFVCKLSTHIEPDSFGNLEFSIKEKLYDKNKGKVIGSGSACGINLEKFDASKKEEYRKSIRKEIGISDDAFTYIYVGRINRDKGVSELLCAYKDIVEREPKSHLIMVGSIEGEDKFDQEAYCWSQKSESVTYTGSSQTVEKYLSASDCYILPSYREGFGMGVIEAEAMKIPVIITDIPGPRDAVTKESSLMVKPKDKDSLETAMKLIRNKDLSHMGESGYKFVLENFEQKKLLSKILDDRKTLLGI